MALLIQAVFICRNQRGGDDYGFSAAIAHIMVARDQYVPAHRAGRCL